MSRDRFRELEVDGAEASGPAGASAAGAAMPVFRRSLELVGDQSEVFAPDETPPRPDPRARPETEPASAVLSQAPSLPPIAPPVEGAAEPGFGAILASGALTACIFALVSLPIRAAFSTSSQDGTAWRGSVELLALVATTLVVRRLFSRILRTL